MRWFPTAFAWVLSYASDKWLHFVMVGMLAFMLNLSVEKRALGGLRLLQWGTLAMLVLATFEEFSQLAVANRTFDLFDLGCNYLGIVLLGSMALLVRLDSDSDNATSPLKPTIR